MIQSSICIHTVIMPSFKTCGVPLCLSNTTRTPFKYYFRIPGASETNNSRNEWLDAMNRDKNFVGKNSATYCCEDHFSVSIKNFKFMRKHCSNLFYFTVTRGYNKLPYVEIE